LATGHQLGAVKAMLHGWSAFARLLSATKTNVDQQRPIILAAQVTK